MPLPRGDAPVFDTVGGRSPVVSGIAQATYALSETQSGSILLFDRAAGITVSLPPQPKTGTYFDFVVTVAPTSGSGYYTVQGQATGVVGGTGFVAGSTTIVPNTAAGSAVPTVGTAQFLPNQTTMYAVKLDGGTSGGSVGSRFRATAVGTNTWFIQGVLIGTGTLTTPFTATP